MFVSSNPKKGIINTAVAIPKGVMKIVVSIHEGFVNLPALYGSEVRDTGEITGFQSGVKKAGKVCYALFSSEPWANGVTGFLLRLLRWYYRISEGAIPGRKEGGTYVRLMNCALRGTDCDSSRDSREWSRALPAAVSNLSPIAYYCANKVG